MALTRVGPKHQITIPREAFEQLGLEPGDLIDVQVRGESLYLVPQKVVPREQAWFWSKEWQETEREASHAIERGDLSGPFDDADQLIEHLRGQ